MKTLVGLAAVLGMLAAEPPPADACSLHLVGAQKSPRRSVAKSSRPSNVLVVGASPRLMRELAAKGHTVDVVASPGEAKKQDYAVVVTDEQHADAARAKYGADHVIVRSADFSTVVQNVEQRVAARRTVDHGGKRVAVTFQTKRTPKAAGGGRTQQTLKDAGRSSTSTGQQDQQDTQQQQQQLTTDASAANETKTVVPKDVRVPNAAKARTGALSEEMFFGLGRSNVNGKASIQRTVAWLSAHATSTIVIEGYADPSGTADANMALSQQRAEAVRDALIAAGADESRIEVQAFGDTKLHYGRADGRNRRVVIKARP